MALPLPDEATLLAPPPLVAKWLLPAEEEEWRGTAGLVTRRLRPVLLPRFSRTMLTARWVARGDVSH